MGFEGIISIMCVHCRAIHKFKNIIFELLREKYLYNNGFLNKLFSAEKDNSVLSKDVQNSRNKTFEIIFCGTYR